MCPSLKLIGTLKLRHNLQVKIQRQIELNESPNIDFNSLTTIGYLLEVYFYSRIFAESLSLDVWDGYVLWSAFLLLRGASVGNLSESFFDTFSVSS